MKVLQPYLGIGIAVGIGLAAWGAYEWSYNRGAEADRLLCNAEWAPKLDTLRDEKLAAQQAVIQAQQEKAKAETALARQLEEQADEYSKRIASLEAGNAGARRELGRLRDALATARTSLRARSKPEAPGSRPEADGSPADTGQLLGACAERLVEVGGFADRLAAQVIGLQAYARLAHKSCGS